MTDVIEMERPTAAQSAELFVGDPVRTADDQSATTDAGGGDSNITPITPLDVAEMRDGLAIVKYAATEALLTELRDLYADKRFDFATVEGEAEAADASKKLQKLRTGLEKKRKAFKAPALDLGNRIDSEAKRITTVIEGLETHVNDQITAETNRRAEEAAARQAQFDAQIAGIRAYADHAQGLPSERIAKGIEALEEMSFGDEWAEFGSAAALAQVETLKTMREMLATTQAREQAEAAAAAERARLEAELAAQRARLEAEAETQRAEAARLAAEKAALEEANAALQRRLAQFEAAERMRAEAASQAQREAEEKARAEAKAKADEEARVQAEAQARADAEAAAQAKAHAEAQAAIDAVDALAPAADGPEELSNDALAADPSIADQVPAVSPPAAAALALFAGVVPTGAEPVIPPLVEDAATPTTDLSNERIAELGGSQSQAVADIRITFVEPPAPAVDAPPLSIGSINERLAALSVTAANLAALGFTPIESKGPGVRFAATDWPLIKNALIAHIEGLA